MVRYLFDNDMRIYAVKIGVNGHHYVYIEAKSRKKASRIAKKKYGDDVVVIK